MEIDKLKDWFETEFKKALGSAREAKQNLK